MTTTTREIAAAIRSGRSGGIDGLYLRVWGEASIVNVSGRARDLRPADVEVVRAAIGEAGYVEVDSWVATEGMSWLSDGVKSVSFRVKKLPRRADPPGSWPDETDFPYGHPGRAAKPLVSDETIAEAAAMEERDRAAGGPPWEVADHPDNKQLGGWHHGQITGTPAPGWEE